MNCYSLLANGVVLQAAQDYRKSLRGQLACQYVSAEDMKRDCEEFFASEWFKILTKVDGKQLMRKLQEEYENESKPITKPKKPNRNDF